MTRSLFRVASAAAFLILASPALAQYKWQGQDGGIVYSDLPPPPGVRLISDKNGQPARDAGDPTLPYPVKLAADRHPVVLYTVPECAPCNAGRQLLAERGVPFAERTLGTAADIEAYKALGFAESSLPGLGVGNDRTTGFEASAWQRLLDAAGYPKQSMLPAAYRQADAQPLTTPAPQKVVVSVGETTGPVSADAAAAAAQTPIERYRQLMQEAETARQRQLDADRPQIRF